MYTKKQKYMRLLAQHSVSQKSGENIKYSLFSGQWYRVRADNTLLLVGPTTRRKIKRRTRTQKPWAFSKFVQLPLAPKIGVFGTTKARPPIFPELELKLFVVVIVH